MTFLQGPRACIGMNFAKAELAILVAGLVGRFEFERGVEVGLGEAVRWEHAVTLRPVGGCKVLLREVEGW